MMMISLMRMIPCSKGFEEEDDDDYDIDALFYQKQKILVSGIESAKVREGTVALLHISFQLKG